MASSNHGGYHHAENDRRGQIAYNRLMNSGGMSAALHSPSSILAGQPPSLYQAFQLDGRTNPLYTPYANLSLLQSSNGAAPGGDIFSAAAAAAANGNQYRLAAAAAAAAGHSNGPPPGTTGQFTSPQHSSANPVLMTQPNLMNSKQSSGIGPIGTKGGNSGQYGQHGQQTGLGALPANAGNSPLLIQYDNSNPINYLPNALQRSAAAAAATGQSGQTAFYQALAASSQQGNGRQSYGLHGFPNAGPGMTIQ